MYRLRIADKICTCCHFFSVKKVILAQVINCIYVCLFKIRMIIIIIIYNLMLFAVSEKERKGNTRRIVWGTSVLGVT